MSCLEDHPTFDFVPGDVLGRYVVIRLLGAGAAGCVFEAHDVCLDRRVALKVLHARSDDTGSLLREARGLARVEHPNVVSVHDFGECHGRVYAAMELVRGQTLDQWLRRERPGWKTAVSVMLRAGRGLAAVHDAGLVHRDFKPRNVVVGLDGRVRVVDFGLARTHRERPADPVAVNDPESARTESDVAGTPAYMPPEAFEGLAPGLASDIWAFIVVTYEALVGLHPFPARTMAHYLERVASGQLDWGPAGRHVPVGLRRAIRSWLLAPARDRPSSIHEVLDVLRRSLAPRRRLPAASGLAAVACLPWLAMSISTPISNPEPKPPACFATFD